VVGLDTVVIAIAQEDRDLESHAKFLAHFGDDPIPFDIVADLGYEKTKPYGRTRTYFIDKKGVVRQVFPQLIHHRASWDVVLGEVKRINSN